MITRHKQFEFSRHALRRVVKRNISEQEICEAGATAEIIESYPQDKYSPSGLLFGMTSAGRALHFPDTNEFQVPKGRGPRWACPNGAVTVQLQQQRHFLAFAPVWACPNGAND